MIFSGAVGTEPCAARLMYQSFALVAIDASVAVRPVTLVSLSGTKNPLLDAVGFRTVFGSYPLVHRIT